MRTRLISAEEMNNLLGQEDPGQEAPETDRRSLRTRRAALRVAMEQDLTPRQKECLYLYFFEGLTMEQVGERLGIGKATVYRHLQRGKRHLDHALRYVEAVQAAEREDD